MLGRKEPWEKSCEDEEAGRAVGAEAACGCRGSHQEGTTGRGRLSQTRGPSLQGLVHPPSCSRNADTTDLQVHAAMSGLMSMLGGSEPSHLPIDVNLYIDHSESLSLRTQQLHNLEVRLPSSLAGRLARERKQRQTVILFSLAPWALFFLHHCSSLCGGPGSPMLRPLGLKSLLSQLFGWHLD